MKKQNAQLILGVILAIFGVILIISSFIVPPLGVIHSSVLAAVGEIFTFAGALLGIDYTYRLKMYKLSKDNEQTLLKEDKND